MESSKESTNTLSLLEALPDDLKKEMMMLLSPGTLAVIAQASRSMPKSFANPNLYLRAFNIDVAVVEAKMRKELNKLSIAELLTPDPVIVLMLSEFERKEAFQKLPKETQEDLRLIIINLLFFARMNHPKSIGKLSIASIADKDVVLVLLSLLEIVQTYVYMEMDKDLQQGFFNALYAKFDSILKNAFEVQDLVFYKNQQLKLMGICQQPLETFFRIIAPEEQSIKPDTKRFFETVQNSTSWGRNFKKDTLFLLRGLEKGNVDPVFCLYALQNNRQLPLKSSPSLSEPKLEDLVSQCIHLGYYPLIAFVLSNFFYLKKNDQEFQIGSHSLQDSLPETALKSDNSSFALLLRYFPVIIGNDAAPNANLEARLSHCLAILTNPNLYFFISRYPKFWETEFGGLTPGYALTLDLAFNEPLSDISRQQRRFDLLQYLAAKLPDTLLQIRYLDNQPKNASVLEALMDFIIQYQPHQHPKTQDLRRLDRYVNVLSFILQHLQPDSASNPICGTDKLSQFFKTLDAVYGKTASKNPRLYFSLLRVCILLLDAFPGHEQAMCFKSLWKSKPLFKHLDDMFILLDKAYTKIQRGSNTSARNSVFFDPKTAKINKKNYRALLDELKSPEPNVDKIKELSQKIQVKSEDNQAKSALKAIIEECVNLTIGQASSSSRNEQGTPGPK